MREIDRHWLCVLFDQLNDELQRMEVLKLQNLKSFTEVIRAEVVLLWDKCFYSQEQRQSFTAYCDGKWLT